MSFQQALALCPKYAGVQRVKHEVHPQDFIFHFLIENKVFETLDHAVAFYFDDGARSAGKLRSLLQEVCGWQGTSIKLLEFASGYGCVTRHMRNLLPEVSVTSCDIHREAVNFIAEQLGGHAVLSSAVPEQLDVPDEYDIVFALSFFSHMPKTTWTRWLNSLLSKVKNGGFLIFTTHGWLSRKYIGFQDLDEDGFWFVSHSEQKDLDVAEYGVTATSPFFVINQIDKHSEGRLVCFREGYWWTHQDLYVIRRELT
jgi:SAM-dependent methyltransferase